MNKKMFGLIAALVMLAWVQPAFSMGGEYGKGDPKSPSWKLQWPVGVKELVNGENRVGGFWINSNDWFYFAGDTDSFNNFLEQYSKLQDTPLTLVLHAGKALPGTLGDKETATIPDWQVSIIDNAWTREAMKDKVLPKTQYTVTVNLWLGGQVDLKGLKVPNSIEVKSGGEIENFVAQHKTKQE